MNLLSNRMQSIQLTRVLKQLLQSHSVVTLPGLGRFRVFACPERFRPHAGTIRSARREVSFEKGDFADDLLLTTALSERFGISVEDAKEQVLERVKEWEIVLHRNQYVELPELGTLYYGAKAKLFFKLREGLVFPLDENAPEEIPLCSEAPNAEPLTKGEGKEDLEKTILKRGKWWLLGTAVMLVGGGIYFYLTFKRVEEKPIWADLHQKVAVKAEDPSLQASAVETRTDSLRTDSIPSRPPKTKLPASAKPSTATTTATPKAVTAKLTRYNVHIVAGSAVPRKTALDQQKQYNRKGIKTTLLTMKNGKCMLSLGLYRTREEAENALRAQKRKISSARIIQL